MSEVQEPTPSADSKVAEDPEGSGLIAIAPGDSGAGESGERSDGEDGFDVDESSVEAPIIGGRYQVLSVLGEGGFGVVYRARQISTNQMVAIKLLHADLIQDKDHAKEYVARFEREMQVIGSMKHPNIVRLIDKGVVENGELFMALEYIDGRSLFDVVEEDGPLSLAETMHLMLQVLDALHAAHSLGIVHRDLKPHNIMLTSTGYRRNAMVLDFGIAGVVEGQRGVDYRTLTKASEIRGTPSYMAPEQLRSKKLSPQSDLYAWGLVFLECLTGVPAVDGDSPFEVALWQVGDDPVEVPDGVFGDGMYEIMKKLTAKDTAVRYQSAAEVFEAFEDLDLSSVAGARATQIAVAANPNRQRRIESARTAALDGSGLNLDTDPKGAGTVEKSEERNEVNIVTTMLDADEIERQSLLNELERGASRPSFPNGPAAESRTSPVVVALVAVLVTILVGAGAAFLLWPSGEGDAGGDAATETRADVSELVDNALERGELKSTLDGITELEALVQADPESAPALGGLARLRATMAVNGWGRLTDFDAALNLAESALAIDAKQTDALVAKGLVAARHQRDYPTAESAFDTAFGVDPTVGAEMARFLLAPIGRVDDASARLEAARTAAPDSLRVHLASAHVALLAGDPGQSLADAEAALSVAKTSSLAHYAKGLAELGRGNLNAAQAAFDIARSTGDDSKILAGLGVAYAANGNITRARELVDLLEAKTKVDGRVSPEHVAWILAALGDVDPAFAWLEQAVGDGSPWVVEFATHPLYEPVRADPRFQTLLLQAGLR